MPGSPPFHRLVGVRKKAVRPIGRWLGRVLAGIGLITVLVISTLMIGWWARAYSGPIEQPKGDVLILLSAAADDRGGISYSSYWRARQALFAWQTGGFKKIVITGGGGPGILNFLIAYGVPRQDMVAEWRSLSTRESAHETKLLTHDIPGNKVSLTSDFHMYRAMRVFRRVGVEPVPDVLHATEH